MEPHKQLHVLGWVRNKEQRCGRGRACGVAWLRHERWTVFYNVDQKTAYNTLLISSCVDLTPDKVFAKEIRVEARNIRCRGFISVEAWRFGRDRRQRG